MFTIFTIPRPFVGYFDVIQRNAVRSWQMLRPGPQILLFGEDEPGTREAARNLGVPLFPVARSPHGRPLISDALRQARELAWHDILVMANTDNIYMSDLPPAVRFVANQFEEFLLIGQRWNLDVRQKLSWEGRVERDGQRFLLEQKMVFAEELSFRENWEADVRRRARDQDDVQHAGAVDYLIWRGDFWGELPDLAVGQKGYDWLLVWLANRAGVPVVDATEAVMVVHQDHEQTYSPEEAAQNDQLITEMYGPDVRGGVTTSSWKLFPDRLMEKGTGREIFWEKEG